MSERDISLNDLETISGLLDISEAEHDTSIRKISKLQKVRRWTIGSCIGANSVIATMGITEAIESGQAIKASTIVTFLGVTAAFRITGNHFTLNSIGYYSSHANENIEFAKEACEQSGLVLPEWAGGPLIAIHESETE